MEIIPDFCRIVFIYALLEPDGSLDDISSIRYVGKTQHLRERYLTHISSAARRSDDSHRTRWVRKLLALDQKPQMVLLQICSEAIWSEREQFWIAHYRGLGAPLTNGDSGGSTGYVFTPDVLAKMSAAHSGERNHNYGKPLTDKQKAQISKANRGRKPSTETRRKLSEAFRKRRHSEATLAKMRRRKKSPEEIEQMRLRGMGKRHTEETKRILSEKAKSRTVSQDTREKIRIASTGRKHSAEARAKISESHKGKQFTEEHLANLTESRRRIAKRKKEERGATPCRGCGAVIEGYYCNASCEWAYRKRKKTEQNDTRTLMDVLSPLG